MLHLAQRTKLPGKRLIRLLIKPGDDGAQRQMAEGSQNTAVSNNHLYGRELRRSENPNGEKLNSLVFPRSPVTRQLCWFTSSKNRNSHSMEALVGLIHSV